MSVKGFLTIPLVLLFGFGLTGCSTHQPVQEHQHASHAAHTSTPMK